MTERPRDPRTDDPDGDRAAAAARRLVASLTLTKVGDRIIDPKTVLAWFLEVVGAPAVFVGLLVPVRESGALLPQAAISPWVARHERRTSVWLLGALGQAAAIAGMVVAALTLRGWAAGAAMVGLVGLFALARSVCSLSIKDVMGRAIPAGQRGRVTGWSASASGLVALGLGTVIILARGAPVTTFAWLFGGAVGLWLAAAWVMQGIDEPVGDEDDDNATSITAGLRLLRDDTDFRHFVLARMLLLASALTPPYIVVLAIEATDDSISGLGPFVIASGLASLVGGRAWGGLADRSARTVMALAAGTAGVLVVATLLVADADVDVLWPWVALYFLLALVHTGSRVGRSTYVVELGDRGARTSYVAISNTVMGLLLLVVGGITSLLAGVSTAFALGALAAIGALGVPVSLRLPETGVDSTDAPTN